MASIIFFLNIEIILYVINKRGGGGGGGVIVYLIKNGGDVCQKQPILIFLYLQSIPCKQECD